MIKKVPKYDDLQYKCFTIYPILIKILNFTMKKKGLVVLVVWIGPLPESFPMWLSSSENQPFDFIFFTDQLRPNYCNHKWNYVTLKSLKSLFCDAINFSVELSSSYKICDFRPAFGEIFNNYISQYDYWGYCDLDIILGNSNMLMDKILNTTPDKLFQRGHLSFFKNTPEINSLYKNGTYVDYKYIYSTNKYCMFDEWHGIGEILKEKNKTIFHEEILVDINPNSHLFKSTNITNYPNQIFVYKDRRIFQYYLESNGIARKEFYYIHFQKRIIDFSEFNDPDGSYIFTSNKLISIVNNEISSELIESYNRTDFNHFFNRFMVRAKIKLRIKENVFDQYVMRHV